MEGNYCWGIGWNNDEMMLQISSVTRLQDCYKKLIDNLCNASSSWHGANAKYIDQCTSSVSMDVDLYEYTWKQAHDDQILMRTAVPYSVEFCKPIPMISGNNRARGGHGGTTFNDPLTELVYTSMFKYFRARSGSNS